MCFSFNRDGVGSSNIVVGTSLGGMDAKCGDVSCSHKVFDENARERNVVTWNAMIGGIWRMGK